MDALAAGQVHGGGLEVIVLEGPDADALIIPSRVHGRRLGSSSALRAALRSLRRGVVVLAQPPATPEDIQGVAVARSRRPGMRALLVNAPDDAGTRLHALAAGFDDAVPRSVGREEIAGRIAVLADRTREGFSDRLAVGTGIELDLTARALRRHGRLVHLRPMEFRLLEKSARNPGRPVSRAWLLRRVWGSDELDGSRTVDVHIRWLRAKVEQDPEHPEHLLTVRRVGYQLELGIEAQDADAEMTGR